MTGTDYLKWLAGLVLFIAWGVLVAWHVTPPEPFVAFVQATLIGLAAHGLTVSGTSQASTPSAPPPSKATGAILPNGDPRPELWIKGQQGGFGHLILVAIMAVVVMCVLAFCAGCSSIGGLAGLPPGTFSNRITCTVAEDAGYVVSLYGTVGVASELDSRDTAAVCGGKPK